MKLLTKNSDYAIRALIVLANKKDSFLSARAIAKEQGVPYPFLRRILNELIKNGLVESREGRQGGFRIKKPAGKIGIVEVMNIFQGDIQLSECMFRKKLCRDRARCVLRKEIKRVEKIVKDEFGDITIEKLSKKLKKGA
ncbi:MAG: Rrf2 family transcriptional regulator [Candidatus Omnitrophota bacterium]